MNVLKAGIINETQKVFARKKSLVILVFATLIPIFSTVVLSYFQNGLGISPVQSTDFSVTILGIFTSLFLPLFVVMTAADLFSGEFSERTMKINLLRPISRLKIYASKIASLGIFIVINLGVVFLASTIMGFFLEGKNGVIEGLFKAMIAYLAAVFPMFLFGAAAAFISQFFKSGSGTLTISILLYIVLKVISAVFPDVSDMLFTNYTDWHLLWSASSVSITKIVNVFMFMLSYSIIFLGSGFYLFDRREC